MFPLRALVVALLLSMGAVPAQAALRVCNKTEHPIALALARIQQKQWISEGWWRLEPKGCQDILRGALKARYYYLRGVHLGADGAWESTRYFCVAEGNFTIKGRENCRKRGFGQAGFFEI